MLQGLLIYDDLLTCSIPNIHISDPISRKCKQNFLNKAWLTCIIVQLLLPSVSSKNLCAVPNLMILLEKIWLLVHELKSIIAGGCVQRLIEPSASKKNLTHLPMIDYIVPKSFIGRAIALKRMGLPCSIVSDCPPHLSFANDCQVQLDSVHLLSRTPAEEQVLY